MVGTILTVVNQGGVIIAGDATAGTWMRSAFNYDHAEREQMAG